MDARESALADVILKASPCPEHAKEACLYGCSHSRRDECAPCALLAAKAVEAYLKTAHEKVETEKWLQAIRAHLAACTSMSPECEKEILNERLAIMLKENPGLPVGQWP